MLYMRPLGPKGLCLAYGSVRIRRGRVIDEAESNPYPTDTEHGEVEVGYPGMYPAGYPPGTLVMPAVQHRLRLHVCGQVPYRALPPGRACTCRTYLACRLVRYVSYMDLASTLYRLVHISIQIVNQG